MTPEFAAYMKKVLKQRKRKHLQQINKIIGSNLIQGKYYPTNYKSEIKNGKRILKNSSWNKKD